MWVKYKTGKHLIDIPSDTPWSYMRVDDLPGTVGFKIRNKLTGTNQFWEIVYFDQSEFDDEDKTNVVHIIHDEIYDLYQQLDARLEEIIQLI